MYLVIRLTVPTLYLVDTCAGGTWSELESEATWYGSPQEAIQAVLAAELETGAELGSTWDVIPCLTPG